MWGKTSFLMSPQVPHSSQRRRKIWASGQYFISYSEFIFFKKSFQRGIFAHTIFCGSPKPYPHPHRTHPSGLS